LSKLSDREPKRYHKLKVRANPFHEEWVKYFAQRTHWADKLIHKVHQVHGLGKVPPPAENKTSLKLPETF